MTARFKDGDEFSFGAYAERFAKADTTTGGYGVRFVASTEDRDLQDERVIQRGLDYNYFLSHGLLTDDHPVKIRDPHNPDPNTNVVRIIPAPVIGEPHDVNVGMVRNKSGQLVPGSEVIGILYRGQPQAEYYKGLMESMARSEARRTVGASVEGNTLLRGGEGNKDLLYCWVKNLAVTVHPVNPQTFGELLKSLQGAMPVLQPSSSRPNFMSFEEATNILVRHLGWSPEQAHAFVARAA